MKDPRLSCYEHKYWFSFTSIKPTEYDSGSEQNDAGIYGTYYVYLYSSLVFFFPTTNPQPQVMWKWEHHATSVPLVANLTFNYHSYLLNTRCSFYTNSFHMNTNEVRMTYVYIVQFHWQKLTNQINSLLRLTTRDHRESWIRPNKWLNSLEKTFLEERTREKDRNLNTL